MTLIGQKRDAKSGQADNVVLFLHGYGADGSDLIGLGDVLAEHLPNTLFIAPDAPYKCNTSPVGFEWFPIPERDGTSEEIARQIYNSSAKMIQEFVDKVCETENIPQERVFLFGFSQGTMMALHVAPRSPKVFAGIVGFSGRLLDPEDLADEVISKPTILLVHGDQDEVVPIQNLSVAAGALTKAGIETYAHLSKGTGHGIAQDGLGVALQFILKQLESPPVK